MVTRCAHLCRELRPWQGQQVGEELEEGEGEADRLVDQLRAEDADKSRLHAFHFHHFDNSEEISHKFQPEQCSFVILSNMEVLPFPCQNQHMLPVLIQCLDGQVVR